MQIAEKLSFSNHVLAFSIPKKTLKDTFTYFVFNIERPFFTTTFSCLTRSLASCHRVNTDHPDHKNQKRTIRVGESPSPNRISFIFMGLIITNDF